LKVHQLPMGNLECIMLKLALFKDVIPRYKTMRGFFVDRKAGWDTHGLPVELEVEKELGFKNKEDIEKYGIAKFNQKCKTSVWKYKNEWEKITERIAFWIDIKDPYITYEDKYIESVWYILKRIWDKGLLFKGFKIVPYCSRCGTVLSSHEVSQGYQSIEENSVYLNFKVTNGNNKVKKNDIILAWTTTPWTLPGNVALAIGEKIDYVKINYQDKKYILAKSRLGVIDGEYKIEDEFKGKDLIDVEYSPLFNIKSIKNSDKKAYYVISADFVSTEDGTGVVHIAPMYGEDDYEIGKKVGLPEIHTVTDNGFFTEDLADYGLLNKFVKDKEIENKILNYLKENELLFKEEKYRHDYPFCWRCDTPLIYYAQSSWFIKMTAVKDKLIENNEKINWVPANLKQGRFGDWIKEVKDWNLSRERYWGTPLPIWQCQNKDCSHQQVIGSIKELKDISKQEINDLHRPNVDKITFKCKKCGSEMKRVSEVIDCWFDSGAMPFAQQHYPFENKELIDKNIFYPADFICEGLDQTRGWFYTLLVLSTALFNKPAFKNVVVNGIVLAEDGQKMSKRLRNYPDPIKLIKKYSADVLRYYLLSSPVVRAGDLCFSEKDVAIVYSRYFLTLLNVLSFYKMYRQDSDSELGKIENLLDSWALAKLKEFKKEYLII